MIAPDDVGRVEPGAHPEDARELVGGLDPVVAGQALRPDPADPHDAAVPHVRRRQGRARQEERRDRRAAVGVRRHRFQLGERPAERAGRIEARLPGPGDRDMKLRGGAVRDARAAVTVVDGHVEPVRRRLDRPAIFHVIPEPDVGRHADPRGQSRHGFGRAGGSSVGRPAHSATSSVSSMMT